MKSSSIVLRFVSAALLTGAAAFVPVMAQSGPAFKTLNTAQPSGSGDKVEVMEFFAYSCPHCADMEPMVENWVKTFPANVEFIRVPVAFNAAMQPMQQLYYSLEALDKLNLHPKVFDAIHKEGKKLFTKDAIIDWAATQGIDKAAFTAAFDSFGVTAKVKRATEMTDTYAIEGTPSFAIGGKYVTSPGMTGDYESSITQAQKLLDQVLAEKK